MNQDRRDEAGHANVDGGGGWDARTLLQVFLVSLGALVVALSQTVLIPVLASLPAELGTSSSNVYWLLTATLLVGAVTVPILGRMGDMFGIRRMLLVALAALVIGSVLTAVSDNIAVLIAGRAIQGVSVAAVPLGISLLASILPRHRVGASIALVSAMLGIGGALGLPMAGVVAERFDFHALFWITAVAGIIAFAGVLALVPESPIRTGGRVDVVGVGLLSAGLVCLILPLSKASDWGWSSPGVWGLLIASVLILLVLGWAELRIPGPLVDMRALARWPILATNAASILFGFALFASMIGTASYVQAPEASGYGFGSSIVVGGLALLPSGLAMLVFAPVSARLIARRGAPQTLALGALVVALGWLMRIVFTGSLTQVIVGTTVVGIGTGIGYASIPALINVHTPAGEISAANGLNTLFRSVGSSFASALGATILAASTITLGGNVLPDLGAYRGLFVVCAVSAVLAAAMALLVPRHATHAAPGRGGA